MKELLLRTAERYINELFPVACDIFDHPEAGGKEVFASDVLTRLLGEKGFNVERGIANLPTAFRATYEKGRAPRSNKVKGDRNDFWSFEGYKDWGKPRYLHAG